LIQFLALLGDVACKRIEMPNVFGADLIKGINEASRDM